jgi:hypothetical protein
MSKTPYDYEAKSDPKKPSDMGESQPLKVEKAKNSNGAAWHGFKRPAK